MTADCNSCSFSLAAAKTPTITSYTINGKTLQITGTQFTATNDEVKVILGDLIKVGTLSSTSSISVTFDEYPKPGSPLLEVQFKDDTSYRIGKVTSAAVAIPLAATIASSVTTSFEGRSKLRLIGNGIRELAEDGKLGILICSAFKCEPDLEAALVTD